MQKPPISYQNLVDIIKYDHLTGQFKWGKRRGPVYSGKKVGHVREDGSVLIRLHGKSYLAHRLAWLHFYGEWPEGHITHIDGNKSNNIIKNLQLSVDNEPENITRYRVSVKQGGKWKVIGTYENMSEMINDVQPEFM